MSAKDMGFQTPQQPGKSYFTGDFAGVAKEPEVTLPLLGRELSVISLVADQSAKYRHGSQYGVAQKRALDALDSRRLVKRDEECRLVHHAENKCQFILANCPDETAGLLNYLSLYYCKLPGAQPAALIILILWLGLLFSTIGIAASDFFCINLSTIASILGMSESMAGVTFLAFGNGSPDVFSTFAAMGSHSGSLAVGELIGAAGFITAVVAGSMALVREFKVGKKTFVRDIGFFNSCSELQEAAARGQYLVMTNEEIEVAEEDGDDEDAPAGERGFYNNEDFGALERGSSPHPRVQDNGDSDEDGDEGMHIAAEVASSMRFSRRPRIQVGAIIFAKVSRLPWHQINLRRYSDDPSASLDQAGASAVASAPASEYASSINPTDRGGNAIERPRLDPLRSRAVSMTATSALKPTDPAIFTAAGVPDIGIVAATPTFPRHLDVPSSIGSPGSKSPTFSISPPPSFDGSKNDKLFINSAPRWNDELLAPPDNDSPAISPRHPRSPDLSPKSPSASSTRSRTVQRPQLQIPTSSRDSSRTLESEPKDEDEEIDFIQDRRESGTPMRRNTGPVLIPDSPSLALEPEPEWLQYQRSRRNTQTEDYPRLPISHFSEHNTAAVAIAIENHHPHSHPIPHVIPQKEKLSPRWLSP
ncbi:hypothetical protein DID88_003910 [Monilinia fructigena]|uniref:Sodium/calcium exchanger membrane region domain-containing protein n=1 Tax=Monilinia fructigena TaxID=38457 RepID=A0A395IT58_9HELO|nr:hypothetical protein DID88_003910 [Monilinia fructigena]